MMRCVVFFFFITVAVKCFRTFKLFHAKIEENCVWTLKLNLYFCLCDLISVINPSLLIELSLFEIQLFL